MPDDPAGLAKVVLDSLALRYASVLRTIEDLTGETVTGVHVVGGGSQNDYLNQATADASGRPVVAGPVGSDRHRQRAGAGGRPPAGSRSLADGAAPRRGRDPAAPVRGRGRCRRGDEVAAPEIRRYLEARYGDAG